MNRDSALELMSSIPSQTSLDERYGLYVLASKSYSGKGYIYDIGTAAGGSTYCLALGLSENNSVPAPNLQKRILGFDLFSGYSLASFKGSSALKKLQDKTRKTFDSDLELFNAVTYDFRNYILPVKLDIVSEFSKYRKPEAIEIVHIDAAKSRALWKSICPVISEGVMPGLTTFVFQDFERCRLPWQWMYVADLLREGIAHWASEFEGGTVHLKIERKVPKTLVDDSIEFAYDEGGAVERWKFLTDFIKSNESRLKAFGKQFDNISNCTLAYIYWHLGRRVQMKKAIGNVDECFLQNEAMYRKELLG